MILADVNVWVYAFRSDSPFHAVARQRLERCLAEREPFLFSPSVGSSFLRLVTNPRIFRQPSEAVGAWEFLTVLQDAPSAQWSDADAATWGLFKHISLVDNASSNAVPDAFLAALAIRHDATLITADRDFGRFGALRTEWLEPRGAL